MTFNETRTAELSIAHALSRPLHGFSKHVMLSKDSSHEPCSAIQEGLGSTRPDRTISLRAYRHLADLSQMIGTLAAERQAVAVTIFMNGPPCSARETQVRAFSAFIRSTGRHIQARKLAVTVVLNDTANMTLQGDHGLGIASQLDIRTLAQQTGVRVILFGSFHRALKLPGAFMAGDKHLMAELRVLCPSYSKLDLWIFSNMTLLTGCNKRSAPARHQYIAR